jgi:hypothetical protein
MIVMILKNTELMGVLPPVLAFTLLLPYPPNPGNALKHDPTMFAAPSAISSLFGLCWIPLIESLVPSPPPRLLAATEDSKNPRRAIKNDVLIASRI